MNENVIKIFNDDASTYNYNLKVVDKDIYFLEKNDIVFINKASEYGSDRLYLIDNGNRNEIKRLVFVYDKGSSRRYIVDETSGEWIPFTGEIIGEIGAVYRGTLKKLW